MYVYLIFNGNAIFFSSLLHASGVILYNIYNLLKWKLKTCQGFDLGKRVKGLGFKNKVSVGRWVGR